MRTRRDPDVDTVWTTEPLLKTVEDLDAFLKLPRLDSGEPVNSAAVLDAEGGPG